MHSAEIERFRIEKTDRELSFDNGREFEDLFAVRSAKKLAAELIFDVCDFIHFEISAVFVYETILKQNYGNVNKKVSCNGQKETH
jgi:hypothetical protein